MDSQRVQRRLQCAQTNQPLLCAVVVQAGHGHDHVAMDPFRQRAAHASGHGIPLQGRAGHCLLSALQLPPTHSCHSHGPAPWAAWLMAAEQSDPPLLGTRRMLVV